MHNTRSTLNSLLDQLAEALETLDGVVLTLNLDADCRASIDASLQALEIAIADQLPAWHRQSADRRSAECIVNKGR
jgi:hypothetical protein